MAALREFKLAVILAGLVVGSLVQIGRAQDTPDVAEATDEKEAPKFLRIEEERGKWVALDIASREFQLDEGLRVALVGVAHIGDRSFYRSVERLLSEYDLVLYESVMPSGARGAGGDTDAERIASTKSAMGFVGGLIEGHFVTKGRYPDHLEELEAYASKMDPRLGAWLAKATLDGWGRPLFYGVDAESDDYTLLSYGGDGREGGEDDAADINLADLDPPMPLDLGGDDNNIQVQLAEALSLDFQLAAIDYSHPNWQCSDMAMDQVDRALADRGVDFEVVGGALAGTSMTAKIAKVFLGFIKVADSFLDGAIADTFKVILIEMLGDETMMRAGMDQFGEGFEEVIVDMRNQVVIDDLATVVRERPEVKSVAILYGAAHMDDMVERLEDQLGATEVDEVWLRAIEVDIEASVVSARELAQMRMMMRQMMQSQQRP